jgi:putative oxidoreductase
MCRLVSTELGAALVLKCALLPLIGLRCAVMSEPTSIIPTTVYRGDVEPTSTKPTRRPLTWNAGTDLGLLLLRFAIGGTIFAHGVQKVFGMWGYPGIGEFTRSVEQLGYQQPSTLAWVVAVTELVAGGFVVLGLITPLAAAALLSIKINTVLVKLAGGFFIASQAGAGAVELDVVLGIGAAALVFTGPGRIALDNGRSWHRRPASWGVLSLVVGVAAAVLVYLFLHRR